MSKTTPASAPAPEVLLLGPPGIFKHSDYEKRLCEKFRVLKPHESPIPLDQFLRAHAGDTTAMICGGGSSVRLGPEILHRLPSLRIVVSASAGLNFLDLPECRRRGLAVTFAGSVFSADVADEAVGLLIDVLRRISAANRFVKSGNWTVDAALSYPLATKLSHKRVGIVGLGSIGQEVAKRLEAFDCKISYQSRTKKPAFSYPFYSDVRELASDSDILVICCALTDQTYHLITKEVLEALGERGVIVNIARGAIIDEKELVRFLVEGKIAGAGLDVFEHEPKVPSELFGLDNVVLAPHYGVYTDESFGDLYDLMVGNLDAFFSGQPLISPLDLEEY